MGTSMWWDYDIDIMLTNEGLTSFRKNQADVDKILIPFGCGYENDRVYDKTTAFQMDIEDTKFEDWASKLNLPRQFHEPCFPIPKIKFKCIKNPEVYLTKRCGDWGKYPPKTYFSSIFLVLFVCFTAYKLLKRDFMSWIFIFLASEVTLAFIGTFICLFLQRWLVLLQLIKIEP